MQFAPLTASYVLVRSLHYDDQVTWHLAFGAMPFGYCALLADVPVSFGLSDHCTDLFMTRIERSKYGFMAGLAAMVIAGALVNAIEPGFPGFNKYTYEIKAWLGLGPEIPNPFPNGDVRKGIYASLTGALMHEAPVIDYMRRLVDVATTNHLKPDEAHSMVEHATAARTLMGLTLVASGDQAVYLQIFTKILEKTPPAECPDISQWPPSPEIFAKIFGNVCSDVRSRYASNCANSLKHCVGTTTFPSLLDGSENV